MNLFSFVNKNKNFLEEELKNLEKAQEILNKRFEKKEVSKEIYKQKSLEFMLKKEKIMKKLNNNK